MPVEQVAQVGFKQNIHYLRGLAALSVVFSHALSYHATEYGVEILSKHLLDVLGIFGVGLFFAISGYLMAALIQTQNPFEFLLRRSARIYPLFILVVAITIIAYPKIWTDYKLASLSLAPIGQTRFALGGIEWTLVYEMFFYVSLFFVSLLGLRARIPLLAATWFIAIMAAWLFTSLGGPLTLAGLPLQAVCIGLAGGLLIHKLNRLPTPLAFCIAVFTLGYCSLAPTLLNAQFAAGIGCVCVVLVMVRAPAFLPDPLDRVFGKLGDWSYGLYLIHIPVIFVSHLPIFKQLGPNYLPMRIVGIIAAGAVIGQIDMMIHNRVRQMNLDGHNWHVIGASSLIAAAYVAIAIAA